MSSSPVIANLVKIQPKQISNLAPSNNKATLVPFVISTTNSTISPVSTNLISKSSSNVAVLASSKPSSSTVPILVSATSKTMPAASVDSHDTNFKVDHLQQLSTNALPSYFPKALPDFVKNSVTSFEFHCCSDCGDTFVLKSSLSYHLERRSVLIKFPCDTCKINCMFTNRCALLSHIRNHKDKGEASNINRAIVSPLPKNLLDGLRNQLLTSQEKEKSNNSTDTIQVNDLLETSFEEAEESVSPPVQKPSPEKKKETFRCWDCNENFDSSAAREDHLTNGNRIPSVLHQCNRCVTICPSKCSLKAHQRIHLQVSPYVCPECGSSPDVYFQNFQNHVTYKCLHYARKIGYRCHVCSNISESHDELLKHMEVHTEKYLKCDTCPRAYLTRSTFQAHLDINHKDEKNVKYNMIYKCSLCDIVFLDVHQMKNHRSAHIKQETAEFIFRCMQCQRPMDNKIKLLEHIKDQHPNIYNVVLDISKKSSNPKNVKPSILCLLCEQNFPSAIEYKSHIKMKHTSLNKPCNICYSVFENTADMVSHGKKHLSKGNIVCLLCHNRDFDSAGYLSAHLNTHLAKIAGSMTYCPLCPDQPLYNSYEALTHLKADHSFNSITKKRGTSTSGTASYNCFACNKTFGDRQDLASHNCPLRDSESRAEEPPLKKHHSDGSFHCYKCDYSNKDKPSFKEHIVTHKSNRSSFQCQECGICFMVLPALEKHLKIIHKIRDVQKYIEEEGTNFTPEENDKKSEASTFDSFICDVCFTTFHTQNALNSHMRIHGLAFLQANKSDSQKD